MSDSTTSIFRTLISLLLSVVLIAHPVAICAGESALAPNSTFAKKTALHQPDRRVFDYPDDAAIEAAHAVIAQIETDQKNGKKTVIVFFTGNTARTFYREFVALVRMKQLDMSTVISFNLDEYVLPPKDPRSFRSFMNANLFDHVNILPENIHFLSAYDEQGRKKDEAEVKGHLLSYEKNLIESGGPDIALLGIGPNGHIAFNEPGRSLDSGTDEVTLSWETRVANKEDFDNDPKKVPEKALTMGISSILKAKKILLLAFGDAKRQPVHGMLHGPVGDALPASFLRMHPDKDVTVFADRKAIPSDIVPDSEFSAWMKRQKQAFLVWTLNKLQSVNEMKFKYSVRMFMTLFCAAAVAGTATFGQLGLVTVSLPASFLVYRNMVMEKVNPFLHADRQDKAKVDAEVLYEVVEDGLKNQWHIARPKDSIDPLRPIIVFDHGHDPFELISGAVSKIRDFLHIFSVYPYDIRYYWGDVKNASVSFLSRCAKGMYLRHGKTIQDLSSIISTSYANMPHWPFSNLEKFKTLTEGALGHIHGMIQRKELAPTVQSDSMVSISYSVGARARFIETLNQHVRYDPITKRRTLDSNFDPKVRGLVLINPFFHVSRIGNKYMRWQRQWFWDQLAAFRGRTKTAYDEMDRSNDLTKIHQRARLAAQHKDWPQVVWISTRVDDPQLQPLPWAEFSARRRHAKGFAIFTTWAGIVWECMRHAGSKAHTALTTAYKLPWYYWLGSMFWDPRGDDGIVDPDLAAGLDYYGKPLDPRAISIVVRGIAHDAMGEPLIQKLSFQLADLIADGVDLHHAYLEVESEDRKVRRISLANHRPDQPIVLDAHDRVEVYLSKPLPAAEQAGEILLAERAIAEEPLASCFREWNAQPLEALKILEFYKSFLARKAWTLSMELDDLGPHPAGPALGAQASLPKHLAGDWMAIVVLMEVWLSKGLLSVAPLPTGMELNRWNEIIASARDLAAGRSKSRWIANPFEMHELARWQVSDRSLYAHAKDLAGDIDDPEKFSKIFSRLILNTKIWRDLAKSFEPWIWKRMDDFTRWLEASVEAQRMLPILLDVDSDSALESVWEEFTTHKIPASELFHVLATNRPRQLLQLLLTLDLKIPVGPTVHLLFPAKQAWDAGLVEAAL